MAKILSADDQPHMTYIISSWLTKLGHEVVRVEDGAAALERLDREHFDLLISDVDMPRLDGLSLLKECLDRHSLRGIIILTGRSDYEELRKSVDAPHVRLLAKPFSPRKLSQLVDGMLAEHPAIQSAARLA